MRSVIDFICLEEAGLLDDDSTQESYVFPDTLRDVIPDIKAGSNFRRYPVFWQLFLWAWGGFQLTNLLEQEHEELSKQTGVPTDEIPHALEVYDSLFPIETGWMTDIKDTELRILKMVPVPFRGLGAFHRLKRHRKDSYVQLGCSRWTSQLLANWHQVGYRILE